MPDEEKDEEYPISLQGSRKRTLMKSSRDSSSEEDNDDQSS